MELDSAYLEVYGTINPGALPSIQLNNSFDASMLHSSESDQTKLSLRQVASWDASRPCDQEPTFSAKKSASRPQFLPPTTALKKKAAPGSVKRQRTVSRKSPRRRLEQEPSLDSQIVPKKRAPKDSLGTYTTAASTLLDETLDSADDSSSTAAAATSATFRFSSFPASLPRLPQSNEQLLQHTGGPDTIRKRMSFGGLSFLNHQHASSAAADDYTNNTSLSSVGYESDHSHHQRHGEEEDSNCSSSIVGTPVLRTRLNFNAMLSPKASKGGKKMLVVCGIR